MLAFQRRVLEEIQDERNPLIERVKFLSILGSNLGESSWSGWPACGSRSKQGSPT